MPGLSGGVVGRCVVSEPFLLCPQCTLSFHPPDEWMTISACDVRKDDVIIRNVVPGYEWVPGPYGAFVVKETSWSQDEVRFMVLDASGCDIKIIKVSYDAEEAVMVKRKIN